MTPLVIAVQGLALLGTLVYAAADAVVLIGDGGSDVAPVAVAGYGALTAVVGLAVAWWLPRSARGSELVAAEAAQWRAGAMLSVMMTVGAGVALALRETSWSDAVRYVDPVLVLIAVLLLAPVPVRLLRSGVNELLEGAPTAAVQARVDAVVAEVRAQHGLGEPVVRVNKVGRKLYVEVTFVVEPDAWTVADEDRVRHAVIDGLDPIGLDVWAYVELTTEPELAD